MPVAGLLTLGAGLLLLVGGGELLIRGATRLALIARISPVVIGLTVVSFGTSAPEIAVGVQAGLGEPERDLPLAFGNVIGTNIVNVLLVLGAAALITPISVPNRLVRLEVPLMIGVSGLLLALCLNGVLGPLEAAIFLLGLAIYVAWALIASRSEGAPVRFEARAEGDGAQRVFWAAFLTIAGLALLVPGARLLIDGSTDIARSLGVDEFVIGLTVVAAGTSAPELVTTVMAAFRGAREMAVGNIIGSNIFNILGVLGVTALVAPDGIPIPDSALRFDIPVMIAVAVACLPVFFAGGSINRWEGFVFVAYYVAYALYLLLDATGHAALGAFSVTMLLFVMPLTAITLVVVAALELRELLSRRRGVE